MLIQRNCFLIFLIFGVIFQASSSPINTNDEDEEFLPAETSDKGTEPIIDSVNTNDGDEQSLSKETSDKGTEPIIDSVNTNDEDEESLSKETRDKGTELVIDSLSNKSQDPKDNNKTIETKEKNKNKNETADLHSLTSLEETKQTKQENATETSSEIDFTENQDGNSKNSEKQNESLETFDLTDNQRDDLSEDEVHETKAEELHRLEDIKDHSNGTNVTSGWLDQNERFCEMLCFSCEGSDNVFDVSEPSCFCKVVTVSSVKCLEEKVTDDVKMKVIAYVETQPQSEEEKLVAQYLREREELALNRNRRCCGQRSSTAIETNERLRSNPTVAKAANNGNPVPEEPSVHTSQVEYGSKYPEELESKQDTIKEVNPTNAQNEIRQSFRSKQPVNSILDDLLRKAMRADETSSEKPENYEDDEEEKTATTNPTKRMKKDKLKELGKMYKYEPPANWQTLVQQKSSQNAGQISESETLNQAKASNDFKEASPDNIQEKESIENINGIQENKTRSDKYSENLSKFKQKLKDRMEVKKNSETKLKEVQTQKSTDDDKMLKINQSEDVRNKGLKRSEFKKKTKNKHEELTDSKSSGEEDDENKEDVAHTEKDFEKYQEQELKREKILQEIREVIERRKQDRISGPKIKREDDMEGAESLNVEQEKAKNAMNENKVKAQELLQKIKEKYSKSSAKNVEENDLTTKLKSLKESISDKEQHGKSAKKPKISEHKDENKVQKKLKDYEKESSLKPKYFKIVEEEEPDTLTKIKTRIQELKNRNAVDNSNEHDKPSKLSKPTKKLASFKSNKEDNQDYEGEELYHKPSPNYKPKTSIPKKKNLLRSSKDGHPDDTNFKYTSLSDWRNIKSDQLDESPQKAKSNEKGYSDKDNELNGLNKKRPESLDALIAKIRALYQKNNEGQNLKPKTNSKLKSHNSEEQPINIKLLSRVPRRKEHYDYENTNLSEENLNESGEKDYYSQRKQNRKSSNQEDFYDPPAEEWERKYPAVQSKGKKEIKTHKSRERVNNESMEYASDNPEYENSYWRSNENLDAEKDTRKSKQNSKLRGGKVIRTQAKSRNDANSKITFEFPDDVISKTFSDSLSIEERKKILESSLKEMLETNKKLKPSDLPSMSNDGDEVSSLLITPTTKEEERKILEQHIKDVLEKIKPFSIPGTDQSKLNEEQQSPKYRSVEESQEVEDKTKPTLRDIIEKRTAERLAMLKASRSKDEIKQISKESREKRKGKELADPKIHCEKCLEAVSKIKDTDGQKSYRSVQPGYIGAENSIHQSCPCIQAQNRNADNRGNENQTSMLSNKNPEPYDFFTPEQYKKLIEEMSYPRNQPTEPRFNLEDISKTYNNLKEGLKKDYEDISHKSLQQNYEDTKQKITDKISDLHVGEKVNEMKEKLKEGYQKLTSTTLTSGKSAESFGRSNENNYEDEKATHESYIESPQALKSSSQTIIPANQLKSTYLQAKYVDPSNPNMYTYSPSYTSQPNMYTGSSTFSSSGPNTNSNVNVYKKNCSLNQSGNLNAPINLVENSS